MDFYQPRFGESEGEGRSGRGEFSGSHAPGITHSMDLE